MPLSAFARAAPTLRDRGLSIIPIKQGEKRPGVFKAGFWTGMLKWERFCDEKATDEEVEIWSEWPDAGIGIALGRASGVVAVDVDCQPGEIRDAIERLLPPSPIKKVGHKGYTAFYRFNGEASRKWRDIPNKGDKPVLELLSQGNQTVLPPSMHPDGMEYKYLTPDTFGDMSLEDLPELPASWSDKITEALAPFATHSFQEKVRETYAGHDRTMWSELNRKALDNMEAWVPEMFPMAKKKPDGSYRVAAHWRGGDGPNVSIHQKGVTDWARGENFSPIDLVMRANDVSLDNAVEFLSDRVESGEIGFQNLVVTERAPTPIAVSAPQPLIRAPENFFNMPGLIGEIHHYILKTSIRPQPIVALGAILVALGTLMGRNYRSPTDLRTNLYAVGVCDSAGGKDYPRKAIAKMLTKAGLERHLGGLRLASGSGLISAAVREPRSLFMIDEFGLYLEGMTDRKRSPRHILEIYELLMEFFSSSNSVFKGKEYANRDKAIEIETIHEPCIGLFGTTTPSTFWKALKSGNVSDGSLARFLVFMSEEDYPDATDHAEISEIPENILAGLKAIADGPPGRGNLVGVLSASLAPYTVPYAPEVRQRLKEMRNSESELLRHYRGTVYTAIWGRWIELTIKVAMIAAIALDYERPVICTMCMDWAESVVGHCLKIIVDNVEEKIADNDTEANSKRLESIIAKAGAEGISTSLIIRQTRNMPSNVRRDSLGDLVAAGRVSLDSSGSGTKQAKIYRTVM
jgi:hypothetical protein